MPNRDITVITPLDNDQLLFSSMHGHEQLGRLFEYELELLSPRSDIPFDKLVGEAMSVQMELPDVTRSFHGVVSRFAHVGHIGRYARYHATLVPWLWFLTRAADCRVFQDQTVPQIINKVLNAYEGDVEDALGGDYRKWSYCVQYRETDFNFISRLMEQEGIYYYFKHDKQRHTLVLSDSISSHGAFPKYEKFSVTKSSPRAVVQNWTCEQQLQPGKYAHSDFNFEKPARPMQSKASVSRRHANASLEVFDYPGEFAAPAEGDRYARVRIEEMQCQHEVATADTTAGGIACGYLFDLLDCARADQNREYLITSTNYELRTADYESTSTGSADPHVSCQFSALTSREAFRPARSTPKPMIQGPQTAIIVGKTGEEIWTDKHGRVKVRFHWDRHGKNDGSSSCWIRVAQAWAGDGWGTQFIPRIGQEVIVEFLEGDPDRPIITGRVYNGANMPPYDLTKDQTISTIKSHTTKDGKSKNFNELRFDDKKDKEEICLHAERDFNRIVENDDTLQVGFDKKDPGDQKIEIYNDRTRSVANGNDKLQIKKGNRDVAIDAGDDSLTISKGNQKIMISAGKSQHEAAQAIELKVGGSSIKIEPTGITLKAPQITIQADAKMEAKAPMVTIKADGMMDIKAPMTQASGDGMLTLKGGLVKIN